MPFQLNVPACAWYAADSWALALAGLITAPDCGVQENGSWPSWLSSCCRRRVLYEPVVQVTVVPEASRPPEPTLAPPTETIPLAPPGIFSVTLVFSEKPTAGV